MKLKKFDSINVIPFIDVLLVLLAIVLMTSTFISKGIIPISLPYAKNSTNINDNKSSVITIKSDGTIYLDNKISSLKDIEAFILTINKNRAINIKSDKNAKFDSFIQVLDILKSNNIQNISIITKK
ncbi:TonB system transport protein ExbD [Arcobacter sp. CECT 8986]|uniref:TonB system transport protein ExbD n=1 Tax=Arcobacter sp. CECT 8986 TaxID=2044507 RepID=UPI001009BD01|nr:TonB system transport protein ExbD [Arcobacter sp. CECT 8986]RXK00952.1 TonB system transport protein ExbD [Arcobacter sp. CECT 8986]